MNKWTYEKTKKFANKQMNLNERINKCKNEQMKE